MALALQVSSCETDPPAKGRCSQTWSMGIKRVYEVDPLACPQCGGTMEVIAFIEPPQGAVIEKVLRHCGLWRASSPRAPPDDDDLVYVPDEECADSSQDWDGATAESAEPGVLTFVDMDAFWATF